MSMRKCQIYKKTVWQVLARQKTILIADRSSVYFLKSLKREQDPFCFFLDVSRIDIFLKMYSNTF